MTEIPDPRMITPTKMLELDARMETAALENTLENHRNLINCFFCDESPSHVITTVDLHIGKTPMRMLCTEPECKGTMVSAAYRGRDHINNWKHPIDKEWFRPFTEHECHVVRRAIYARATQDAQNHQDPGVRDLKCLESLQTQALHILEGGLILRNHKENP